MWILKIPTEEGARKSAWQHVKGAVKLYYAVVIALLWPLSRNIGWTRKPEDLLSWYFIVFGLALPFFAYIIFGVVVSAAYVRGLEEGARQIFGSSYFETERWLVGKHVDLREALKADGGLDCERGLAKLKDELEDKLFGTSSWQLTQPGREELRQEHEGDCELTRSLTLHDRTGRWK